jgi:hypothetical protein
VDAVAGGRSLIPLLNSRKNGHLSVRKTNSTSARVLPIGAPHSPAQPKAGIRIPLIPSVSSGRVAVAALTDLFRQETVRDS